MQFTAHSSEPLFRACRGQEHRDDRGNHRPACLSQHQPVRCPRIRRLSLPITNARLHIQREGQDNCWSPDVSRHCGLACSNRNRFYVCQMKRPPTGAASLSGPESLGVRGQPLPVALPVASAPALHAGPTWSRAIRPFPVISHAMLTEYFSANCTSSKCFVVIARLMSSVDRSRAAAKYIAKSAARFSTARNSYGLPASGRDKETDRDAPL